MSIVWRMTIRRLVDLDLLDQKLEARIAGLIVSEPLLKRPCETFDSTTGHGVFRIFGRIDFDKTDRRWSVSPCAGASSLELANLISRGCYLARKHGRMPGQGLRGRVWRHTVGKNDGHRYAWTYLARPVGKDELIEISLSEAINDILTIGDDDVSVSADTSSRKAPLVAHADASLSASGLAGVER